MTSTDPGTARSIAPPRCSNWSPPRILRPVDDSDDPRSTTVRASSQPVECTASPKPRKLGTDANARLTSSTALVLLVLLAVEGVTVLRVGSLLTLHVFIGMLLVPPVLVKLASTFWRFAKYYSGSREYREKDHRC